MSNVVEVPTQAEMTIRITDLSIVNDVRRLLKRVNGVESITVRKKKSEVELSLEEAHSGKITRWSNVDDYFQAMMSK